MNGIDWKTFAERVPAGTRVLDHHLEGILLEVYPYSAIEININFRADWPRVKENHQEIDEMRLKWHRTMTSSASFTSPTFSSVDCLLYFINDKWLTFAEVMA